VNQQLFALRQGNVQTLLTGDVSSESRVLMYRDIATRAERIAPFLRYDGDPYLVLVGGRMIWVLDAYTTTDRFPFSAGLPGIGNWMRNSVKVTVDAYDGSVSFWRMPGEDPIIDAWAAVFPNMMKPVADMPAELRKHLRYPSDWFNVQAHLYATYHMREAMVFYNREDEWQVPAVGARAMEPYYTIMKLPGETEEEFIVMLPFVPRSRPNLAAWMVARSDVEHYGQIVAYTFPKEKMVYGPGMIIDRINQDARISEKLSLWNQQGSVAMLGTLLVIPIEESLIYVQPLYLRAENGGIPELKRVIVGYQNEIAMQPTLEAALAEIFGDAGSGVVSAPVDPSLPPADPGTDAPPAASADPGNAARRATSHLERAQAAAGAGEWDRFGEELEALENALREILDEESSPPATSVVPEQ
jgi:uncharacterized membrane protein (UPF0182 family)